jgi:hypothetical protein
MEETVKVDKRSQKTPEQLELLRLAREKANAIRGERSQVKKDLKHLKELSFQKDKELVEKMAKKLKPPPEPEPESEEEVEIVKKPKKKKIVYVSDSEEEEERVKKPKAKPAIETHPAAVLSKLETTDYIQKLQRQRMRNMLFGGNSTW